MWTYRAHCYHVVDGDTFDVAVDLGFMVYHKIRIRLRGVDTPEIYGAHPTPEGKAASDYVKALIENKDVVITTYKTTATTFNRWEADVQFTHDTGALIQLSEHLVELGYAKRVLI